MAVITPRPARFRRADGVPPLFIVEAWASKNPRVRWPLVGLLILLLMGLAGGLAGPEEVSGALALPVLSAHRSVADELAAPLSRATLVVQWLIALAIVSAAIWTALA